MLIGDIALTSFEVVEPLASVASIERKLAEQGFVVVIDDDFYKGLLTVEDTIRHPRILVIDCLTEKPSVSYSTTLDEVLSLMERESQSFLPVFRDHQFFGVSSYRGIALQLRLERERSRGMEKERLGNIAHFDAMRALAGGIAHDFNNYFAAILGNIDLISSEPGISDKNAERLKDVEQAVEKASTLAKQLQAFARRGTLSKEKTNIATLIKENATFMSSGCKIQLEFSFAEDLREVELDRDQFSRVISNLVINAAQAMSNNQGKLSITGNNLLVDDTDDLPLEAGWYLKLMFQDTGSGMNEEIRAKIFEPYFTTKTTGSGLGLAVVYSIIIDHGGYIDVESAEGKGTLFRVYLPTANG